VASYPRRRQFGDLGCFDAVVVRWPQVPGPVRAMLVVVRDVLVQDRPRCRGPAISIRSVTSARTVRTRRLAWAFARGLRGGIFTALMPTSARTASNDVVNCPARSRIRNRNRAARSPRSISRFRACWVVHASSGCAVTPRTCTYRVPTSSTKNTYRRRRVTAVDVEEVARQHRGGLRSQELPPGRAAAPRRGRDPQAPQHPPHRGCPDPVAEAEQFALDPLVAPARVLPRHLPDQRDEPGVNRRASSPVWVGPPPADQAPVPAQQRVRRHQPTHPQLPGQEPGQGSEHHPTPGPRSLCWRPGTARPSHR